MNENILMTFLIILVNKQPCISWFLKHSQWLQDIKL